MRSFAEIPSCEGRSFSCPDVITLARGDSFPVCCILPSSELLLPLPELLPLGLLLPPPLLLLRRRDVSDPLLLELLLLLLLSNGA